MRKQAGTWNLCCLTFELRGTAAVCRLGREAEDKPGEPRGPGGMPWWVHSSEGLGSAFPDGEPTLQGARAFRSTWHPTDSPPEAATCCPSEPAVAARAAGRCLASRYALALRQAQGRRRQGAATSRGHRLVSCPPQDGQPAPVLTSRAKALKPGRPDARDDAPKVRT
jgi:hypothetical protein